MDIVELSDEEIWEIYRKDLKKFIISLAKNIYDDSNADPQAGINLYRSTLINVMYGLLAASEFANNTDHAD